MNDRIRANINEGLTDVIQNCSEIKMITNIISNDRMVRLQSQQDTDLEKIIELENKNIELIFKIKTMLYEH